MAGPRRRHRGPEPAPHRITVRLNHLEYRAIKQAASAPGKGISLARFLAESGLAAAGTPPRRRRGRDLTSIALAEIIEATAAVNRIGNNLNQLAREKNATGRRPTGTFAEIERARAALDHLAETTEAVSREPS